MEILRGFLSRRGFVFGLSSAGAASRAAGRLCLLLLLMANHTVIGEDTPTEYQLKAAFLYNFAKFVEWPPAKLPANAPIVIGVLGEDPFGPDLDRAVIGKSISGHSLETRRYNNPDDARDAHILFISDTTSERRRLSQTLNALRGSSVLTVSDIDGFCDAGGIINFRILADKVRFEISTRAADQEGLKISSRLLTVASKRWK